MRLKTLRLCSWQAGGRRQVTGCPGVFVRGWAPLGAPPPRASAAPLRAAGGARRGARGGETGFGVGAAASQSLGLGWGARERTGMPRSLGLGTHLAREGEAPRPGPAMGSFQLDDFAAGWIGGEPTPGWEGPPEASARGRLRPGEKAREPGRCGRGALRPTGALRHHAPGARAAHSRRAGPAPPAAPAKLREPPVSSPGLPSASKSGPAELNLVTIRLPVQTASQRGVPARSHSSATGYAPEVGDSAPRTWCVKVALGCWRPGAGWSAGLRRQAGPRGRPGSGSGTRRWVLRGLQVPTARGARPARLQPPSVTRPLLPAPLDPLGPS